MHKLNALLGLLTSIMMGRWYFIVVYELFGEPLPFSEDRAIRVFIASILPGGFFWALGLGAREVNLGQTIRKWLAINLFGLALSLLLVALMAIFGWATAVFYTTKLLLMGTPLLIIAYCLCRPFWKWWRLILALPFCLIFGFLNYRHAFVGTGQWSDLISHQQQIVPPDGNGGQLEFNLDLKTGHAYQFALLPHEGDLIEVRMVIGDNGGATLFLRSYRHKYTKHIIVDRHQIRLTPSKVNRLLEHIEATHFWELKQEDLKGKGDRSNYYYFQGYRNNIHQKLTCPGPLNPTVSLRLHQRKLVMYRLAIEFLRTANAKFPKRYLQDRYFDSITGRPIPELHGDK